LRYSLDRRARRLDHGRVLLAGSPLTLFRLGPAGQRAVDAIGRHEEPPGSAGPLLERLVEVGAAHPEPGPARYTARDVTLVVPVRGHDPWPTVAAAGPVGHVVVVDDASMPPLVAPPSSTVELLRHDANVGPGAARMSGLERVRTPLVAFVDADVVPEPGWLEPLLGHFGDERVALGAPRVRSMPGPGVLARYETSRSPLDLGAEPGRVLPATRIGYVPAAAVVARAAAVREVGGFDIALRTGEDVDLVWRLVERGWRVRYEPRSVVRHLPRRSWRAFLGQRAGYGSSAAPLHRRHPGSVAPAVVRPWTVAGWVLLGLGHPLLAAAAVAAPVPALRRALTGVPGRTRLAIGLDVLGFVATGEHLASALRREWWPFAALLALASPRRRRLVLLAAVVPALVDWWRITLERRAGEGLDPLRAVALRLLDDGAYGAGVWAGVWTCRDAGALLPRLAPSAGSRRVGQGTRTTRPKACRLSM
jgi:mycofactocin system glycosyltransferase